MQITLEGEDAEKLRRIASLFRNERKALDFSLGLFLFVLETDKRALLQLSGLQPRSRDRERP